MKDFTMPITYQGQVILWYPHGDTNSQPVVGITQKVSRGTIEATILIPDNVRVVSRSGIRHVSDPNKNIDDMQESGLWDFVKMPSAEKKSA